MGVVSSIHREFSYNELIMLERHTFANVFTDMNLDTGTTRQSWEKKPSPSRVAEDSVCESGEKEKVGSSEKSAGDCREYVRSEACTKRDGSLLGSISISSDFPMTVSLGASGCKDFLFRPVILRKETASWASVYAMATFHFLSCR